MNLQSDLEAGRYDDVVAGVAQWIADDRVAAMSDPIVSRWCALRWKDLFLREAVRDPQVVERAGHPAGLGAVVTPRIGPDRRSDRQKVADRFLKGISAADWDVDLPEPAVLDLS